MRDKIKRFYVNSTSRVLCVYNSVLPLCAVIPVWSLCSTFEKIITNHQLQWKEVYKMYAYLKQSCHYTNEAFGSLFGNFFLNCAVFPALSLDYMTEKQDFRTQIHVTFLLVVTISTNLLAVDSCQKVMYFK